MANYTVIADVGRTLVQLLQENLVPDLIQQPEMIGLAPPADKGDLALSLFLYSIKESGESRQNEMIMRGAGKMQFPPMSVDLYYLITAHSNSEIPVRSLDEHRILGRVMQVLYDHSILRGSALVGSLAEANEEVRIVMNDLKMETLVNFFPNMPYKLSISYAVGPVNIDSTRIRTTKRVLETDFNIIEKG